MNGNSIGVDKSGNSNNVATVSSTRPLKRNSEANECSYDEDEDDRFISNQDLEALVTMNKNNINNNQSNSSTNKILNSSLAKRKKF